MTKYFDDIVVTEETLKDEIQYIVNRTKIPAETVETIIKGIDAFYCLMGIQETPTFKDEYGMFIKPDDEWKIFHSNTDAINEGDMLSFIFDRSGIDGETIERILYEDLLYMGICQEQ